MVNEEDKEEPVHTSPENLATSSQKE
ncbi:hypothetical protein A2U01_0110249, partial [Trifolium medium]|nr:hypothetical protein [Trifolium medium]